MVTGGDDTTATNESRPPDQGEARRDPSRRPLYGATTTRAKQRYNLSAETMPARLIRALADVKAAAAVANHAHANETGVDAERADAITRAADEIVAGAWLEHFPIDVFQTGSGTATNTNMNEVLAARATALAGIPVHPNDHVNASQSSNDTMPTALRVAALESLLEGLIPSLRQLERELTLKARQFATIVKAGRTHLMDATPILMGDEFQGYATQIGDAAERLSSVVPRVAALPLGGTATGNGINAPVGFGTAAVIGLAARTDLPLTEASDHFAVQGAHDALIELSGQVRGAAISLYKVANDLRVLASGPRTGLGEIEFDEDIPGSSIMPAKTNPIDCEVVLQVSAQVIGNDTAVAFAGTQGNLELNTFLPLIARNLLGSMDLLANATTLLADACVRIRVDLARCREHAEATDATATALTPHIGYDAAACVVREARRAGRTIEEVVTDAGLLDAETAAKVLDLFTVAKGTIRREPPKAPFEDPEVPPSLVPPAESGSIGPTPASTRQDPPPANR